MEINNTEHVIEALLFAYGNPVHIDKVAIAINKDTKDATKIIDTLMDRYAKENRGIQIVQVDNTYQMCTNHKYFQYIEKVVTNKPKKNISQTLIETLAIIAYKQPITKTQIEDIRGVSAHHAINKLLEYNLICEKGRLSAPGKPILFGTTIDFLKHFGFSSLKELPTISNDLETLQKEAIEEINSIL